MRTTVVQLRHLLARLCRSIDSTPILEFPELTAADTAESVMIGLYTAGHVSGAVDRRRLGWTTQVLEAQVGRCLADGTCSVAKPQGE